MINAWYCTWPMFLTETEPVQFPRSHFHNLKKTLKGPGGRITMGPCPTLLEKKKKRVSQQFFSWFLKNPILTLSLLCLWLWKLQKCALECWYPGFKLTKFVTWTWLASSMCGNNVSYVTIQEQIKMVVPCAQINLFTASTAKCLCNHHCQGNFRFSMENNPPPPKKKKPPINPNNCSVCRVQARCTNVLKTKINFSFV